MSLEIGQIIEGKYRIVRLIGEGGMGAVYRAKDTKLNREVALKVLPPEFAADTARMQRFEREARAMSRLSHPHCVSVIDFGMHDAPYIVMDFVTGATPRAMVAWPRRECGRSPRWPIWRKWQPKLRASHDQCSASRAATRARRSRTRRATWSR